ncbi:MAG: PEP-CTERM sorting domain-containing protein [Planctomycetaceae bacterium]|nr:PEP-CTERM sorting domain-containing protein [Planctomycetaceae bacterium]
MASKTMTIAAIAAVLLACSAMARADADPPAAGAFTLVIMPDTQSYTQHDTDLLYAQTQWIADHVTSNNIAGVIQVGDLTQNNYSTEWTVARNAMDTLNGVVPYVLSTGNHDYGPGGDSSTRATTFNSAAYFGAGTPYATQASIGGFFEAGKTDNSYSTFTAAGKEWIVLSLEFAPRNSVVAWADQVLTAHPDAKAIVTTHAYLDSTELRYDWDAYGATQEASPRSYGLAALPGGANDGQDLWDSLISKHDVAFVFSGHALGDGVARNSVVNDTGTTTHEIMANYQDGVTGSTNGGNGYLRLVEIVSADIDIVHVRTYSPSLDAYLTGPQQDFLLMPTVDTQGKLSPQVVIDQAPVLYHRLSAESGSDVTNYGSGGASLNATYSGSGGASQFDGSAAVVTDSPVAALSQWSVSAWVRSAGAAGAQTVFSTGSGAWNDAVLLGLSPDGSTAADRWAVIHQDDQTHLGTSVADTADAVAGQWYQLTAVSTGGVLRLYVNGVLSGQSVLSGHDLDLGAGLLTIGHGFEGTIAEVALYDRPLGTVEVMTQYQAAGNRVVAGNVQVGGATDPNDNTVGAVSVPQQAYPGLGVSLANEGDVEMTKAGSGLKYTDGVLLASVRQGMRDGVVGTVEVGRNSFATGFMALSTTQAGANLNEININTAVAWFPFSGGWIGGHVDSTGTIIAGNGVMQSMLTVQSGEVGRSKLDLGVDSRTDGLLFAIGGSNWYNVVQTGVLADGSGWDIRVQTNTADFLSPGSDTANFAFVYLPGNTPGLIGGRYDGYEMSNLLSFGDFTMVTLGAGMYRLTIDGQTPETGMLLLTDSFEVTSGGRTAPDDNILSYESDGNGGFLIYSRDLPGLDLQHTQFSWAFVSFDEPLGLGEVHPVPEPVSLLVMLTGSAAILLRRKR